MPFAVACSTDKQQMAAWEFQTLQNIAEKHGWHKFVSMQNYYNLLYREEGQFPSRVFFFRAPLTMPCRA